MDVLYPNKINEDYNEEVAENTNQFADDRYPSIFAKFKIDSRLDKTLNPDLNLKRSMYKRDTEKPNVNSREMSPPKTSLSKTTGGNSAVVEEELKNILDDMGLIDDYGDREENKREISEDENLEQGTNKINLIKEDHNETRNKRGDVNGTTENGQSTTQITQSTMETTVVVPTKVQFEDEHTEEAESIDLFKADSAKLNEDSEKEDLDSSTETVLEELRKKRQFDASDSNNNEDKRDTTDTLTDINLKSTNLVKEAELNQYEKRVEREIRDKIQKLKEEVKEEIKNLKENPKMNDVESDTRRKKRQVVNTLIDEETQDIDPNFNVEGQHEGHVRRKRSSFDDNNTVNVSNTNYERNVEQKENLNYNNDIFGNKNSEIRNKTSFEDNYFSLTGKQNIDKKNDGLLFEINFGDIDPNINEKIKSNYLSEGNGHVIEKKEVNSSNNIFEMGSNLSKNRERTELKLPTLTYLKTFVNDTGKEKNMLNVINDIKYINENNYHTDIKNIRNNSCITCQTIPKHSNNATEQMDKSAEPLIQTDKNKQVVNNNGCNVTSEKKIPKTKRSVPPSRVKISVPKQFHGNNTLKPYLDKIIREIDSFEKEKRFLGVNPILENTTNRTDRYQESPLKKFSENTMKTILASHDNKTVDKNNTATLNDINPIVKDNSNPADHYRSRSLKQFNENGVKENPMNEIHVKVKKSGNQNGGIIENSSNNRINMRKTRQSKEDTEEHDYQYDDPRFSEEVVADNQTYDEQPYDSDDNVEGKCLFLLTIRNIKSQKIFVLRR